MNFCSRFLRLSVVPRCRERPQIAMCFLEWLGRLKWRATGLDASLSFRLPIAILAAFIVCIGPLFVCSFIIIFKFHGDLPPEIGAKIPEVIEFIINKMLLHSWGALNPCICFAFSENYRTGFKHLVFGRRRASRTAFPQLVSIENTTLVSRRTKRSSSSDHVSMKSITEAQQERLKRVGAEKEQGQIQKNTTEKQKEKPMIEEINHEENASLL